jgi:FkbM family methyltransferase
MFVWFLRRVRPLRLRQVVYFRLQRWGWKPGAGNLPAPLALAPVSLAKLFATDYAHQQIIATGLYEIGLTKQIVTLARVGGMMIDAGANAGYFSVIWASLNPANKVIAFEPSPRNLDMLRTNIVSAGLRDQVDIVPEALGRVTAKLPFHPGPEEETGWGGFARAKKDDTIDVLTRRLDDLLSDDTNVAVLKVDCEGADPWVLEGAERLLRGKRIKNVFFELNPQRQEALGIPANSAFDILRGHGYRVVVPRGFPETEFRATISLSD